MLLVVLSALVAAVMAATVPTDDIIVAAPGSYLALFGKGSPTASPTYEALSGNDNETMAGLLAAFHAVNKGGGISHAGRQIRTIPVETFGFYSTFVPNRTAAYDDFWATFGGNTTAIARPGIIPNPTWVAAGKQAGVPVVGAFTDAQEDFEPGHRASLHLRTAAGSELLHLLHYMVHSHLHLRRFFIMHPPKQGLQDLSHLLAAEIRRMGLPDPVIHQTVYARNTSHFPAWYASLPTMLDTLDHVPHCVVPLVDAALMSDIIEIFSKSRHFKQGHMFFFATSIGGRVRFADSTNSSAVFQNLFLSMSFPFPSDTSYAAVRAYQRDVTAWRGALTAQGSVEGTAFERDLAAHTAEFNMFAIEGYMTGRAIAATLRRMDPVNVSGAAFTDAFFETRMFALDDLVFGPFSDGCVGRQTNDTGACWCNSGARRQYIVSFGRVTGRAFPVTDHPELFEDVVSTPIPLSGCAFDEALLREPMIVTAVRDPDFVATTFATAELETPRAMSYAAPDPAAAPRLAGTLQEAGPRRALPVANVTAAHDALVRGALRVLSAANKQSGVTRGSMYTVAHDMANATAASVAGGEGERYKLFAAAFPLARPMALAGRPLLTLAPLRPDLRFLDRDPDTVPPADHDPNVLQVLPAMADLLHTAAAYASERGMAGDVAAVVDSANLLRLARLSVESFGRRMRPSAIVHADAVVDPVAATSEARAAQEWAAAKASNAAAPAAPTAADVQRRFLAVASPSADPPRVVIVATHEPSVVDAVLGAAGSVPTVTVVVCTSELLLSGAGTQAPPSNVLFTSGLPGSSGLGSDPLQAYGTFVGRVLLAAHRAQDKSTAPAAVAAEAFKRTALQYEGAAVTRLNNVPCAGLATAVYPHPGGACQCSKAVNAFSLFNHTAASVGKGTLVTDYEQVPAFTMTHSECGVAYTAITEPSPAPLLTGTEVALTAGGCVMVLLLGGLIGFLIYRQFKDSWAARHAPTDQNAPFAMVFTDIQASTVLWARLPEQMGHGIDVHHATLRDLISTHKGYEVKTIGDSFMVAFKDVNDATRFALATQAALYDASWGGDEFDAVYDGILEEQDIPMTLSRNAAGLWRGIRVRVGVHYGTGQIVVDENTKHYDYYGTVVNLAARVEGVAHGGQVLLTDAATAGLAGVHPADYIRVDLGPQPLRGIEEPVRLLQMLPVRFADRRYPALRLDVEIDVDDGGDSTSEQLESPRHEMGHTNSRDTTSDAPTNAADGARALITRLRGRVALSQLLLVDKALATLLATESRSGREKTVRRWAERWRLPRLRRRDQRHFSLLPADELGRLRVAMRVVESMTATGNLESDSDVKGVSHIVTPPHTDLPPRQTALPFVLPEFT